MDPHQMQLGIVGEHTITRFENLLLGRESGSCCGTPLAGSAWQVATNPGRPRRGWRSLLSPNTAHAVWVCQVICVNDLGFVVGIGLGVDLGLMVVQSSVTRRRRGCGNVGIPRLLRDFQVRWERWKSRGRTFPRVPPRVISTAVPLQTYYRIARRGGCRPGDVTQRA